MASTANKTNAISLQGATVNRTNERSLTHSAFNVSYANYPLEHKMDLKVYEELQGFT